MDNTIHTEHKDFPPCQTACPILTDVREYVQFIAERRFEEAFASGKEAAISIDRYLKGEDIGADRPLEWKGIELEPQDVEHLDRQQMQRLSIAQRKNSFEEIDSGFSEEQAKKEAGRCLKICGAQIKVM